jgi:hypothetical protein
MSPSEIPCLVYFSPTETLAKPAALRSVPSSLPPQCILDGSSPLKQRLM